VAGAITILHDSFGPAGPLKKDWGFAALVEFGGRRILFDAGNNAATFKANVEAIGVDLGRLDLAVISHRHGDHTTGLECVLSRSPRVPIYVPKETYGVFGSALPGTFYPRCPSLPLERRYYDGFPPELIRHGTPWTDADFRHVGQTLEIEPGIVALHTVSDVAGTREMPELSLSLRSGDRQVIVTGCSHCGIEKIAAAALERGPRIDCIFGGLHLVVSPEPEILRVATALHDGLKVRSVAPGHCTGEPGFDVFQRVFGADYRFAGLGMRLEL